MNYKKTFIIITGILAFSYGTKAQVAVPGADSLTSEEYSQWLTNFYTEHLNLNDWQQQQQAHNAISEQKKLLDVRLDLAIPEEKNKAWKRYYSLLDSKFGKICTKEQYSEYEHLNLGPIKTVNFQ